MRRLILAAVATSLTMACWWRLGSGTDSVTFSWAVSDDGAPDQVECHTSGAQGGEVTCGCFAGGVTQVQAVLAGQRKTFTCDDLLDGGTVGAFEEIGAGHQTYAFTGLGPVYSEDAGTTVLEALYWSGGTLDVAESSTNLTPTLTLQPLEPLGGTGDILLRWTFGGESCAEAGVASVQLQAMQEDLLDSATNDGGFSATVPCSSEGLDGYRLTGLQPGQWTFTLNAFGARYDFLADPQVVTNGITEAEVRVDLYGPGNVAPPGEQPLELEIGFGSDGGTCTSSGVDAVRVRLSENQLGYWSPLGFDATYPCVDPMVVTILDSDGGLPGYCLQPPCPLSAGEYLVYLDGLSDGSVTFQLNQTAVWRDFGDLSQFGLDGGAVETYDLQLPAVGAP